MKNFFVSVCIACLLVLFFSRAFAGQNYTWNPATGSSAKQVVNLRTACGTPGTVFPTSADTLVFDGSCSNANCVLDTTFNLAKINVKSNYSGSITVSGSITLTFGEGVFLGGTFNGGSVAITFTESLRINGNSFTSTSGVLSVAGDFTYKGSTFTHNSGTVLFKKGAATTTVFSGTSNAGTTLTLYKAEFAATSANTQFTIRNITVQVVNEMKLSGSYQLFLNTNTSSTIEARGNIISSNTASVGGGTVLLLVNGTGSQSINDNQGASISGKLPNIKINKASGTLSLFGSIGMGGSATLEYVAGTINAGTSRLLCYYNNTLYNNSGGTMTLSKLEFIGSGGTQTVTGKIQVTDTFSTSGTGNCIINGDTLELQGNMVWNNTSSGSGGNVVYKFSGSVAQVISGTVTVPLSKMLLKKTSGDISLLTSVDIAADLKFESGYIVPDTLNWVIFKHGATATGASEYSFVKGTVKKIGSSAFVFPVGKDTVYNPIAITAPANSNDAFTAEYFNNAQPHGFNKDSLTYLSDCEYWNVIRASGSSNVAVELFWNSNSCNIHLLNTLRVARWTGSLWTNLGSVSTTGNPTVGTVKTNSSCSSFGYFIIAKNGVQPTANAGVDYVFCQGGSANIGGIPTASGGYSSYTYSWSPSTGLSSSTIANPSASPVDTTLYTLTVTDADGTNVTDQVLIVVNPNPIIDAGEDNYLCSGFEFYLGGDPTAVSGKEPYNYYWLNPENDTVFRVANPFIELDTSFIYFLHVLDSVGCSGTDTIEVNVVEPIQIDFDLDTLLILGQSVLFEPIVTGGQGELSYRWTPGLWLNDSLIIDPTCIPFSSLHYTFLVTDTVGCSAQAVANVDFSPVDFGMLKDIVAFAPDTIQMGDTSIARGDIGSRYINAAKLEILGNTIMDNSEINLMSDALSDLISLINGMSGTVISGNLNGVTLTSGIYQINGSANLEDTLIFSGNDSSYFIIAIEDSLIIDDSAKVILVGIDMDKVVIAVSDEIIMGDELELYGNYLALGKAQIGKFKGKAAILSNVSLAISTNGLDFENGRSVCSANIDVIIPPVAPDITGPNNNPVGWTLVFADEFADEIDISIPHVQTSYNINFPPSSDYYNHKWYAFGGFTYMLEPPDNKVSYANPTLTGVEAYRTLYYPTIDPPPPFSTNKTTLALRLTDLVPNQNIENLWSWDGSGAQEVFSHYSLGQISTVSKFFHGYFEIKVKYPYGKGTGGAFWLYDVNVGYSGSGNCWQARELDFIELHSQQQPKSQMSINQHWCDCSYFKDGTGLQNCLKKSNGDEEDLSNDWHIIAGEWNEQYQNVYVDGVLVDAGEGYTQLNGLLNVAFSNKPDQNMDMAMQLVLNTGLGWGYDSNTGYAIQGDEDNRELKFDYVRVWQKNDKLLDCYFVDDVGPNVFYDNPPGILDFYRDEPGYRSSDIIEPMEDDGKFFVCTSNENFHLVTTYLQGADYNWSFEGENIEFHKDGNTYSPNSYDAEVWFRVTGSGPHSIKLTRFVPELYNHPEHEESMEIFIYPKIGSPSSINYAACDDACYYLAHASSVPYAQYYEWSDNADFDPSYITSSPVYPDGICEEGFHEGLQNVDLHCRAWNECGLGNAISKVNYDIPEHSPPCEERIGYTVENSIPYNIEYISGVPIVNFNDDVDCQKISIFSMQGQLLQTVYSFAGDKFPVTINLPDGIYFINMQINNSHYSDKIIILN